MAGEYSVDPTMGGMSPLGPAPAAPSMRDRLAAVRTQLGTAPAAPVQTTPLVEAVPPMLAAPTPPPPQPTAPVGAIVGAPVMAPTRYTPGGMRADTVESVRTPGAAQAIDRAEALYGAAGELDMAAQRELAATANAQAAAQDAAAAQQRAMAQEFEARERQRAARVDEEAQRFLTAGREAEQLTPSLARASRDAVSTPILAIAQIYAAGAAQQRGQAAPDLISAAIDRQLAQQRAAYDDARANTQSRQTAYGQLRQMGADAREADLAFAARKRQEQIAGLQATLGKITAPAQRAAAAAEIARQQAKHAAEVAELRGKVGDKLTEREKYQAGTTSGGGVMVPVQTQGGTVMMPMAQAAQFQGLMGVTPEQQLKQRELAIKSGELDVKRAEAGVGGGADPKTVLDPEGVPVRFPTQAQADEYRKKFDATQAFSDAKAQLREVDNLFKAGKLTAYEAQQRAEGIAGNVRGAIWTGVRGRTDAPNQQEADSLDKAFPTPQYTTMLGAPGAYIGDVVTGTNRRESGLRTLEQLAADARQAASRLAAQRGVKNEAGRGGRGDAKFNPKPRD